MSEDLENLSRYRQLFTLHFVPFEQELPTKNGEYVLHNCHTTKWHSWQINDPETDFMVRNHVMYTHWALVREDK